ncbi:MAG: ABC transporter permease [Bdellovibrionales bacterium]|nr:ABC transporter permease [Bdellovibrionales bacterium]
MLALEPAVRALGRYFLLLRAVFSDLLNNGVDRRELSRQLIHIGTLSLPIVIITAVFTGMVLSLQTAYGLQRFGAKNYVGNIVGIALTRELGPVLTAIMVCGRVGAGIAAELGSMVVTEQVDAMRSLGANPISKLVTPRIVAAAIALPCLVIVADLIGIYGGLLVAVFELNLSAHTFYRSLLYTLVIRDFVDGLIKSALFGIIVVSIACYRGLQTRGGTAGVGMTTTAAVVTGALVIFVSDFFFTKLLLLFG